MNRELKIGDRVRNVKSEVYKDEPIVVIDRSSNNDRRYHIKYLNVFTVGGDNMVSWIDESDIVLDIEYYRELKIESILDESSLY